MELLDLNRSPTFRLFVVLLLIVALAVPIALVWMVVEMRSDYEKEVAAEISQGWGDELVVIGPFLQINAITPMNELEASYAGETHRRSYYFTPQQFSATSTTEHEVRQKGIFKKPVFVATIELNGSFTVDLDDFTERNNLERDNIDGCTVLLAPSFSQTVKSLSGKFGERSLSFEPSQEMLGWEGDPIQAHLEAEECTGGTFELQLVARGSNRQAIALVGDTSTLTMNSSWPHPKFEGRQLPDDHNISESGFSANWASNALARGFASELDDHEWLFVSPDSVVGYALHEPVTLYRMVTRAVKYGFFVVGLTMLSIFCLEMMTNIRIHAVQYAVVGAALALFYLLVLSFSEHIGFIPAYVIASAVLTLMIVTYAWFSTRKTAFVACLTALLIAVYAALYLCLASTDFALLIGSLLLVILLVGLMYATRNLSAESS